MEYKNNIHNDMNSIMKKQDEVFRKPKSVKIASYMFYILFAIAIALYVFLKIFNIDTTMYYHTIYPICCGFIFIVTFLLLFIALGK